MTLSSVMFYTGENPYTGEKIFVAREQEDKRRQKAYFFRDNRTATAPQRSGNKGAEKRANVEARTGTKRETGTRKFQYKPNKK